MQVKKQADSISMYNFSDSDSVDSDEGIRYKTDSIRNKSKSSRTNSDLAKKNSDRKNKRSRSPNFSKYDNSKTTKHEKRKKNITSNSECDRKYENKKSDKPHKKKNDKGKLHSSEEHIGPTVSNQHLDSSAEPCKNDLVKIKSSFGPDLPSDISKIKINKKCDVGLPPHFVTVSAIEEKTEPKNTCIGPTIPPHILMVTSEEATSSSLSAGSTADNKNQMESKSICPSPPHFVTVKPLKENHGHDEAVSIGPTLPTHLLTRKNTVDEDVSIKNDTVVGPSLPPYLLSKPEIPKEPVLIHNMDKNLKSIGPTLPPHLRKNLSNENLAIEKRGAVEDEEVYGPIPVGENYSRSHIELEERALQMKMDQLGPEDKKQPSREEWMLELPATKAAHYGMGPRQFRAKAGPDLSDRSSWTDTPEEKAKKKTGKVEPKIDIQKEAELSEIKRRDEEQEMIAKKNKKNKKSLLDLHTKKLKKEKTVSSSGPSERRPFSRDIDLQVNRFDEAQKKAVLKKAQLLDNRFSTGESKYL